MRLELTEQQQNDRADFRRFAREEIAPHADRFDREEYIPSEIFKKLAEKGYLGSILSKEWGGKGLDMITYGLLHEELGKACSNVRTILTVHDMFSIAVQRWGNAVQKERWLPKCARGEVVAAFAISEPNVGSDPKRVEATAVKTESGSFVLNGKKKWITFGQIAGVFLVLVQYQGKPTTFIVERDRPGLSINPQFGLVGLRACMLAELTFEDCEIPAENLLGGIGFGILSAVSTALSLGRYTVAWGSVAIAQACLEASMSYASTRKQGGALLKDHQLIRQMLTEMVVNTKAARLLCFQAGYYKDTGDPREVGEAFTIKYFSSRIAMKAALDAVQIHGANGCCRDYPVERHFRDAKLMEIIEGSTQIQQITIASIGHQEYMQQQLEEQALEEAVA